MFGAQIQAAWEDSRKAKEELRALYDGAKEEGGEIRSLAGEELVKEENLAKVIKESDERVVDLQKRQVEHDQATAAYDAANVKAGEVNEARSAEAKEERRSDNDILRAIGEGEQRSHTFQANDVERRDNVNLTAGTATDGAEVIPTTLFGQLIGFLRENVTVMNDRGRQIVTSGGEDLVIPKFTSYSAASIVAEGGTIGKDAPQFATVTLSAYKYGFLVLMSHELVADSGFDIVPDVLAQANVALARGVGAHLLAGSGSGQPNGIVTAATTGVTAASATAITADELIDLQHSVVSGYRTNANFVAKDSTVKLIRKLKDGDSQYLWRPGLTAGAPDTVLGNTLLVDDSMPAATTGLDSVLYGDLSGYAVRFAGGARVTRSDEYGFDSDMVAWRFLVRADGDLVDTNSVRVLTQA